MATLQTEFLTFHNNIKIGTYEENSTLREKRDLLINELTTKLKDEKVPGTDKPLTFKKLDQGSYAMKTGIKPKKGEYDIDVGVVFDITTDEYEPQKLKKLVYDKLNESHNRTVTYNRPCVTVEYSAGYHVDLAIYSDNSDNYHIAWGKQHSSDPKWEPADPKGLTQWVKDVGHGDEQRKQYRRCVRALKKWKERAFSINGNTAPPSIGLTIQAGNAFSYQPENDLEALIQIVRSIKGSFTSVLDPETHTWLKHTQCNLPVSPFKNVYYKMSLKQFDNFYKEVEKLVEALIAAQNEESAVEASKTLRKVFGDDFPLVEDSKATKTAPFVVTGSNA
jgi:hypothetical protein